MKHTIKAAIASAALVVGAASAAGAAVDFDPATGTGFVGKGDVQTALGLNNAQLQAQAGSLAFEYSATSVTETTWTCQNEKNENIREREQTTTTTTQGVVSSVARVKNQITGFNMNGYSGSPVVESETEGPAVGTCPGDPGQGQPWTLIDGPHASAPVVTGSGLTVNGVPLQ